MIGARDGEACGLLRQGLALLDAQREAMIGGKLDELARINAELADWISRMPRPAAAARETIGHADATRLLGTLRGNAVVAQRAESAAQRGLSVLVASPDPLYEADGRKSAPARRRRPFSV
ncbi:MAG: hypothetical protein LC136_06970 [Burkholderiales bacterium]|jgi:hypothetical protein|nr:hypothetical protein [Burkholderiales bacterium]HMM51040.1 hypothetical protein [Burkholderiaceae bacterium]